MPFSELREIMEEQVRLLLEFGEQEQRMQAYIREHNWTGLNDALARLKPLSETVDEIETRRHEAFLAVCKDQGVEPQAGFYQLIVKMPPVERDGMAELYRELKLAVIKIRGITATVDAYVRTVRDTVNGILENVLPHRKGKLYTNRGGLRNADGEALVVNAQV